jgi:hypothetical protein
MSCGHNEWIHVSEKLVIKDSTLKNILAFLKKWLCNPKGMSKAPAYKNFRNVPGAQQLR